MAINDFAPQSHFFTRALSISQDSSQAFGPVSANEFRATCKFTVTGDNATAFAVCTGVVLIQPQAGSSNKVNLILRPYRQPVQGVNIRYFVYRGINKADLFEGEHVKAKSGDTSGFINKINTVFQEFYQNNEPDETPPAFLAKYIGFDPAGQTDESVLLDNFFFKQSEYVESNGEFTETEESSYELPMAEVGMSLGNFSSGECGIDIVLNYGDYKLPVPHDEFVFDLAYARAAEAKITIPGGTDAFKQKVIKEQIYQFLDSAAYFGYHSLWEKGIVTVDNNGTKEHKKGQDIYTSVVDRFFTRNRLYLYIQSDRGRSYNFYGQYNLSEGSSNSLKIGWTEETMSEKSFNTQGWPLLIDEAPRAHSDTTNKLFLQFVTDKNVNTVFYGQIAQVDNAHKNNFIDAENLLSGAEQQAEVVLLTKPILLSNPATAPDNARLNVASFNILLYQGKTYGYKAGETTDEQGATVDVIAAPNFFDDVFDLIGAEPLLKAGNDSSYSIVTSQKVKLINHYFDKQQHGISAVQSTIVNDVIETADVVTPMLSRVTYITEAVDVLNSAASVTGAMTADTKSSPAVSGSVTGKTTYELPAPFYYTLSPFTDSTEMINGLELKSLDGSVPNKIILGITKAENEAIRAIITSNSLSNARLFLVDLFEDGNQLISAENILYQKYRLGVVGEKMDGIMELYLPGADVMVYSLDRKFYFSSDYSKHIVVEVVPTESLSLDLNITV